AAELAGILRAENAGCDTGGDASIEVTAGHPAVARIVYLLLKRAAGDGSSKVIRNRHKPPKRGYVVRVSDAAAGVLDHVRPAVRGDLCGRSIPRKACCRRAYLRGAFLMRGSVA